MNIARRVPASVLAFAVLSGIPLLAQAPNTFTLEQILSAPFAYELVSAKKADRIAWLEFERGRRNVYTAAAPEFRPVRLTNFRDDDGTELTNARISDDGAVVVFVRGSDPNRDGWVANPAQAPDGSEQAIWGVRTGEAKPFRIAAGNDPRLSPDGRLVLYEKDDQIYGAPVKPAKTNESDVRPLFRTWGKNGGPVWSPDGTRIAFVSDRKDHGFIGVYDVAARRIQYLAPSVDKDTSPSWSGDGKRVAFIRRPGSAFAQITAAALAEIRTGRQTEAIPAAILAQIASNPPSSPSSSASPPPTTAAPATGPGFQASKFADGRVLTFWTADAATGEGEMVWREPLDDPAYRSLRSILWAGDRLIFEQERNNWRHEFAVPASGGLDAAPVDLTPGQGETEFIALSGDGRTLFYTSNVGDIDRRHLWRAPTAGGEAVQLTKGEGIETEASPLASGGQVAVFYADSRRPRAVALVPSGGGAARVIETNLPPDFPSAAHVGPENVVLKAADGLEFHNQVFAPRDIRPGEKRPALLFTHGGPIRQMLLGYHYMFFYHMAYAVNQYFADRGYVVISVNYRSGIGYGRDFRQAPKRGAGGSSEYQDVLAAAKYLQSRPDVDPGRIGLWGLSYGGLLTALGLSRNSDIFKAGVDIAGVHLWGNSLDTNSTAFKASAIATVDQWTSPVLLVQGDDDRNVAFSQTTGLVQLLRARSVPHELIVFPDEVHDFLVFVKWLRVFHAAEDFFQRKLGK